MTTNHAQKKWWHKLEETILVVILALMMAITFVNVVLRSGFNSSLLWGLEATTYLFAWLVLLGLGYLVRTHTNLGVDAVINLMNAPVRKVIGLVISVVCIVYALLLLKGAYDFSANFYNLPATEGRVIPNGLQEMKPYDYKGYTPVFDIPMPDWLRPIWEPIFLREGDAPYNKLPINIPYMALFIGVLWMFIQFIVAFFAILRGVTDRLIASHEVEDAIENLSKEGQ